MVETEACPLLLEQRIQAEEAVGEGCWPGTAVRGGVGRTAWVSVGVGRVRSRPRGLGHSPRGWNLPVGPDQDS